MSNVKLNPEAKNLYSRNPELFKQKYCDMYVNGLLTGGQMFGLVIINTTSKQDKSNRSYLQMFQSSLKLHNT